MDQVPSGGRHEFDFGAGSKSTVGNIQVAPEAEKNANSSWTTRVKHTLIGNDTRIASVLRVGGDILTATSGGAFDSWARVAGASASGLSTVLGSVYKNIPQTAEERQELDKMSTPFYVKHRLKQVFDPKKHIRQTLGGGAALSGFFYLVSGLQSDRIAETFVGASVIAAGGLLTFTKDDAKAWKYFSTTILTCITPLGIMNGIQAATKGDWLVPIAQTLHLTATLINLCVTSWRSRIAGEGKELQVTGTER